VKSLAAIGIGIPLALGVAMFPATQQHARAESTTSAAAPPAAAGQPLAHTQQEFTFTVDLPVDRALPLFGAHRERDWAPDWSPDFLWPAPVSDREGMVFSVAHDDKTAIWVNTALDPLARRVQYVYVIPEVVATVITIALTPKEPGTQVSVRYERTALAVQANRIVERMAAHDRTAGPVWEHQIKRYLNEHRD
jgi:hypothetical protein